MPRSFVSADRFERHSLNRAEKASLGRYSVATDISLGSAATQHWVNSVSDIYGPDEIEELLEDLNRLEMASFDADDYDIDGSQLGGGNGHHGHMAGVGMLDHAEVAGRSGGGVETGGLAHQNNSTPSSDDQLDSGGPPTHFPTASPTWSIKSWDSHTHYQEFKEPDDDPVFFPSRPMQSIVCYCDMSTFKSPRTILRVLLVVTSIACLSTLLTAGTAKTGLFALPHFPRLRLMMFVTIFAIIFTTFVLFLNVSHLHPLLPVDYGKLQTVAYLFLTAAYLIASSMVLHSHQTGFEVDDDHPSLPSSTKTQILIVSILGFACGIGTFLCSFNCTPLPPSYDKMAESSTHFTLHETATPFNNNDNHPTTATTTTAAGPGHGQRAAAAAVPPQPMRHSRSAGGCQPPVSSSQRHHQYLVNENYDSDRVISGAARALKTSASHNNATTTATTATTTNNNHSDSSHNDYSKNSHNNNNNSHHNNKKSHASKHHDPLHAAAVTPPPPPLPSCKQSNHPTTSESAATHHVHPAKGHTQPHSQQQPHGSSSSKNNQPRPEHNKTSGSGPGHQTGAIPKQKQKSNNKPSANHLDEIVTLPLDDL